MKNKKVKILVGTLLLMLCSVSSYAQLPPGFGGDDNNVDDTAPISSLVVLGLIAGAIYGIKKMK